MNLPQDGQWRLFLAVAVSYLLGRGPFPVLILQGGQGSCKSTAARVLRELIDPAKGALRVGQPDPRELMIAATANWIVAFDNITSISPRFSDAVCQLATGAGFGARALWTDDEEFVFDAMRPVIFTGIGGFARRPDLLDRAVLLELPAVDPADRLPEGDFWVDFDNARPQLLGALLDTSAEALATLAKIDPPRLPRMADFARIGIAVERVLDWPEGAFLEALTENSELSLSASLEADPLASVVIKFAESLGADGVWAGEPAETYTKLSERATDELTRRRTWPGDAASMSRRLKELSHALRLVGVEVEWGWTGRDKSRRRQITIRLNEDGGDGGDGSG